MFNRRFHSISVDAKKEKLERVLRGKATGIAEHEIQHIMSTVNFDYQYVVKVTNDIVKFKNMVTDEKVQKDGNFFVSKTHPIFGDFSPGFYKRIGEKIEQKNTICNPMSNMAALKSIREYSLQDERKLNLLIIYIPKEAV